MELLKAIAAGRLEMTEMATEYRRILRAIRDPARLNAALEDQIRAIL